MLTKPKISVGLPFYGGFTGEWTAQTLQMVAGLSQNHDVREIIASGVMTADHNRNLIVNEFLKSDSEWLFWIDSDTLVPIGAVERLLAVNKPLVSGLYYGKNPPHPPIAYFVHNGAFTPIDQERKWDKGELVEVDSAGMGCMLTHRSVYEDIIKNYETFQLEGGGLIPIYKNDVLGDLGNTKDGYNKHEHDGKVYKGQYRRRLIKPTLADMKFPFFIIDNLQTEDIFFFRLADRLGYKPMLDTSVECGHLRWTPFQGADYRKIHGG